MAIVKIWKADEVSDLSGVEIMRNKDIALYSYRVEIVTGYDLTSKPVYILISIVGYNR